MPLPPRPPAGPLPRLGERTLAAGTPLWRVHNGGRAGHAFNPCLGQPSRFAPLFAADGGCIPTLYAGQTREAALFETIFRDLPPLPLTRQVFAGRLHGAVLSELRLRRPLRLAALFNQELALVGLSRQALIKCHGSAAYAVTARWAEAIHRDLPDLDGLVWASRQQDEVQAMLLFGTRVGADDLEVISSEPLDHGPGRAWVSMMAKAYRIDLIPPR